MPTIFVQLCVVVNSRAVCTDAKPYVTLATATDVTKSRSTSCDAIAGHKLLTRLYLAVIYFINLKKY